MTQMKLTDDTTSSCEQKSKPAHMNSHDTSGELWLYKHPDAKSSVLAAIEEIKVGKFSANPPNVDVDEPWMDELED